MSKNFDVVVVPDFAGANPFTFEMRTLFFLAAWMEYAGTAREFPLHLACIGSPPPSVQMLAKRCNASISVHLPANTVAKQFTNKLRGLEIQGQTNRVLLLDADVLILGDFSDLSELGHCIAAAPSSLPRIAKKDWMRIYSSLGMSLPTEQIMPIRGEIGLPVLLKKDYAEQESEMNSMLPYYNSGVIFAPWECKLQQPWEDNIHRISALFEGADASAEGDLAALRICDQASFAVTIEQFKRSGMPFRRLPAAFHSNRLHLYRRTATLSQTKLYHALGLFRGTTATSFNINDPKFSRLGSQKRCRREWTLNDKPNPYAYMRYLLPALKDSRRLDDILRTLYKRYVHEALMQN